MNGANNRYIHREIGAMESEIQSFTELLSEWTEGLENLYIEVMPADCERTWSCACHLNHLAAQSKITNCRNEVSLADKHR